MNTTQLECFIQVADTLSFRRASLELNLSQPTVSKQIESLESELNARLFNRSTRKVELTAAGENFLADARSILADMEHARSQMASFATSESYSIRIGYTEVTELTCLSKALAGMRVDYPNVIPLLRAGAIRDHLMRLEQGSLDMVLGLEDVKYDQNRLLFHAVEHTHLDVIVSQGHPLYERHGIRKEELKRYPQVLYIPEHRRSLYYGSHRDRESDVIYVTASVAETYALVDAGMGYAVVPSCYVTMDPQISRIPLDDSDIIPYGFYTHKGMTFAALNRFAEILESRLHEKQEEKEDEAGCKGVS